ncbi:type III restriction endonuclease [Arcobacter sp. F155]|uniref:DEAD/DEAH box helicase n=1 Tax=Arcobacter sp. F155 TaxID=2044512 RepID=UPI00100C1AD0|nr:DEAD/DEAH box helicase family protein [Arcobacter sp. F155]RXJ77078.1 type III restriction endonuclease [Arcobacter sp. F155]
MAKKKKTSNSFVPDIEQYSLFTNLLNYYEQNKGKIKKKYRRISKVFLDYNEDNYLREPQFKALEIYVFLKEYYHNRKVFDIFKELYDHDIMKIAAKKDSESLFDGIFDNEKEVFDKYYKEVEKNLSELERNYPDYVFALTMGTGKTILMATTMFYEFILANKFPKDKLYAHNALVFAPDKTVLQSLREIVEFDKSKVIPTEYQNFINTEVKYHFLEDTETQLNTLDGSQFNIIITNQQKISLQEKHKETKAVDKLLNSDSLSALDDMNDLLDLENFELVDNKKLIKNQRFEKILRLDNLGIYVDEAHHTFGKGLDDSLKKLKATIDAISNKTTVIGCYNFTGTPYVKNKLIPEVVYAYSLSNAIERKFLKNPIVKGYDKVEEEDFVREVINDFWSKYSECRFEDMLPKLAFFAPNIETLQNELRPAVEKILIELGIDTNKIIVNVGDQKITSNDDLREFRNLDRPTSEKQFILLVNKGQEGWNCRSLFGVALFRKPKSTIFVLQSTMRCLRAVEPVQLNGHIYLSNENHQILEKELQSNFNMNLDNFGKQDEEDKKQFSLKVKEPIESLKIKRVKREYRMKEKDIKPDNSIDFEFNKIDFSKYLGTVVTNYGLKNLEDKSSREKVSKYQKKYSPIMLVAECSAYINKSSILIEKILSNSKEGIKRLVEQSSEYNHVVYDVIIPKLMDYFYDVYPHEESYEEEVPLVNIDKSNNGFFTCVTSREDKVVNEYMYPQYNHKSFHIDHYCFDSEPEKQFFINSLKDDENVRKVFFTGQLTHGQSDFYIGYIDPESHSVRKYYPDFLIQKNDESWVMVEIKGEDKLDDPVVQAKKNYAERMAEHSQFTYLFVPSKFAIDFNVKSILDETCFIKNKSLLEN